MDVKSGDKVRITTKDDEFFDGVFIDKKEETTVIKSGTGYNIGIRNSTIKDVKLVEKGREMDINYKSKTEKNPKLPTISILHTGGTIASKVDYRTGAVYSSFNPEDLLGLFPELAEIADFDSSLVANMWSDDLRFKLISVLAEAVEKEVKKGVAGVIIGIGTDNLAVCSAGLAFALEECPVPVLLVGAQRSSDRGSSDAAMNLTCAAEFITKSDFAGVAVCMHDYTSDDKCAILPACKTKKLHSSRRDAFKPVNDIPIAEVDYPSRKIEFLKTDYSKRPRKGEDEDKNNSSIRIAPDFEEKVGLLKIHINMFPEQFSFFKGYKGLIIEGTGLGHTPGQSPNEWCKVHEKIYPALKEVIESGCVVVMTTNCIFGRVNMNVYDKGRDLLGLGIIPGEDMLSDTAFVKLSWLLANHPSEAKELVRKDLRGEINSSISEEEFLENEES